ncbi:MAG: ACP S-malonyltransferase [bacterium]|nr:ACP S-malonyltransferase [bacterium]
MSKTVLFFPGQASQYVGMGKELYDASEEVRNLYQIASEELGTDIAKVSFEGPAEELKRTRYTQPAILLHSLAVLMHLGKRLGSFDYACGHSLGEYSALAAAGAMSFEDAVKSVVRRADLMEKACVEHPSTMAAVIGLDEAAITDVCMQASAKGVVVPANFNSKAQIVISGSMEGIEAATALAKEAGAKRAVILEVGGAFHSPLMETAQAGMEQYLSEIKFNDPIVPVIANVTAGPVTDAAEIRDLLVKQITSPVRWSQTMSYLLDQGVSSIIEIGPGKVLTGMAKRDMRPEKSHNIDSLADVQEFCSITA